jgi:hypothetical protein
LETLKKTASKKIKGGYSTEVAELIDIIIKEEKYFTFGQAETGKKATSNDLLKEIYKKT